MKLHPYVILLMSCNCFLLYITPRSPGKAADTSAHESFYGGVSKEQNECQIKYPAPASWCGAGKEKNMPLQRGTK